MKINKYDGTQPRSPKTPTTYITPLKRNIPTAEQNSCSFPIQISYISSTLIITTIEGHIRVKKRTTKRNLFCLYANHESLTFQEVVQKENMSTQ